MSSANSTANSTNEKKSIDWADLFENIIGIFIGLTICGAISLDAMFGIVILRWIAELVILVVTISLTKLIGRAIRKLFKK